MADESSQERCVSYGRGGAGNLKKRSDYVEASRTLQSIKQLNLGSQRRRSSSLNSNSSSSGLSRTSSWKNLFRRSSSVEEPKSAEE